jgi:hypothetical protein
MLVVSLHTGGAQVPRDSAYEAIVQRGIRTVYNLEFEKAETADPCLLGSDHLLSAARTSVMKDDRTLPLRRDLFDRDALIFLNLESHTVSLCSRRSSGRRSPRGAFRKITGSSTS